MRVSKRVRKIFNKSGIVLPAAIIGLVLVATGLETANVVNFIGNSSPASTTEDTTVPASVEAPADEAKPAQNTKKPSSSSQSTLTTPSTSSSKKQVKPTITSAEQNSAAEPLEVRAFVSGIFEEGGTCTATFTKGSSKVTRSSTGFENVSYTTCGRISIPRSAFSSDGSWALVVSYKSDKAEGSSTGQTVEVR